AAKLLSRYGSAAVAERVFVAWSSRRNDPSHRDDATDVEGPLLAYFTRVDPARAEGLALAALARARQARSLATLVDAPELHMGPPIERALLEALDDDAVLASSAASALKSSGSAAALPRLWRRLERWSAAWRGKADELVDRRRYGRSPNDAEAALERDLA